jgi:hypothetical protein
MPRDERAYLSDISESCDAIALAVSGLKLEDSCWPGLFYSVAWGISIRRIAK